MAACGRCRPKGTTNSHSKQIDKRKFAAGMAAWPNIDKLAQLAYNNYDFGFFTGGKRYGKAKQTL